MRRSTVWVVVGSALLTSCGGDDRASPGATNPPAAVTESPQPRAEAREGDTAPAGAAEAEEPSASAGGQEAAPPDGCGRTAGLEVDVVAGEVRCADAVAAVTAYDADGPKVQQVGDFACEGAEAAVRPVVLTCVSDAGDVVARVPAR